jgi:acid phosphatase family membrane protein YuiD
LHELIANEALVIPICVWAISQLLKVIIVLIKERHLDLWFLVRSGGMPSSHTALVCALATTVAMLQGFGSVAFAVATILAVVVMYDAAGVRQAVGRLSIVLNRIVREIFYKRPRGEVERDLREFVGHTPFQVIAGAALGIFIAWLWIFLDSA